MNLTIKEIAQLFGHPLDDPQPVTSVEFDSRKIKLGSLFVPLAGTRDGHEFVDQAVKNGAIATLWSKPLALAPTNLIVIPVENTELALQELAMFYLAQIGPKVVAITGSNGKTTTKDMTEAVLAQKFVTYKTQGNYNNNLGMPYTILQMPVDCQMLILEMGMDHAGEISELSKIAHPDAAAITIIGEAHIENLGTRAGIAKAKMEIVDGMKIDGLLLVPADEALLIPLTKHVSQEVMTFGIQQGDITAEILREERDKTLFKIDEAVFEIPVLGGYNVKNALIAYGFGRYFGLTTSQIQQGLATFQLTKNRTEWLRAGNGAEILSDVYNANPTAMGLVLDTFGKLPTNGRKIAVLADMLELGTDSPVMHAAMAEHIADSYSLIFLYGKEMTALLRALTEKDAQLTVYHFGPESKAAMIKTLTSELRPTDSVVIKGSNGMGLTEVVTALIEM